MRLGMLLKYSGAPNSLALEQVLEAERLGYDSVWSGEAYGTDAVTPTAWILARTTRIRAGTGIMQMQARTPACTAMTALTLQALSNNRFLLGIGASGPQVVEGWHGVPFGKPMARTREYIEILRKILKREAALQHQGELYQIPYTGPGATGLGKPLKSILHGDPDMPIYAASITPIGQPCSSAMALQRVSRPQPIRRSGNGRSSCAAFRLSATTGPISTNRVRCASTPGRRRVISHAACEANAWAGCASSKP